MPFTQPQFLPSMLFAVIGPILIVMTTAFVTVPAALGSHPGEPRTAETATAIFHLS